MSTADNYFCSAYNTPSGVWPRFPFPKILLGNSYGKRAAAIKAWNFYELVEFTDAATRIKITALGHIPHSGSAFATSPNLWYPLTDYASRNLYKQGQMLHMMACPQTNWQSQRTLGPVVGGNVAPQPL